MKYSSLSMNWAFDDANTTTKITNLSQRLSTWFRHYRTRKQLSRLDERMLADIGVTKVEAEREASKPFWSP